MTEHYLGGCHCGKVRFEATLDLAVAIECNCSICSRAGWRLVGPAQAFKLLSGADALTDYQFGKKQLHHLFCKTCGVRSFSRGAGPDGQESHMINVRCLDGVDLEKVPVKKYDGKSR
ncbi:MAG: GFA family protein [Deltaproteobacteria bacterium]